MGHCGIGDSKPNHDCPDVWILRRVDVTLKPSPNIGGRNWTYTNPQIYPETCAVQEVVCNENRATLAYHRILEVDRLLDIQANALGSRCA